MTPTEVKEAVLAKCHEINRDCDDGIAHLERFNFAGIGLNGFVLSGPQFTMRVGEDVLEGEFVWGLAAKILGIAKNGESPMSKSAIDTRALGIRIVAAMKASCYGVDIEEGMAMALENTEPDIEHLDPEQAQRRIQIAGMEKKRLHDQADYVAGIVLEYLAIAGEPQADPLQADRELVAKYIDQIDFLDATWEHADELCNAVKRLCGMEVTNG